MPGGFSFSFGTGMNGLQMDMPPFMNFFNPFFPQRVTPFTNINNANNNNTAGDSSQQTDSVHLRGTGTTPSGIYFTFFH